jgi:hypothetical protein
MGVSSTPGSDCNNVLNADLRTSILMMSHGLYALVLGLVELDELAALCLGGCVIACPRRVFSPWAHSLVGGHNIA